MPVPWKTAPTRHLILSLFLLAALAFQAIVCVQTLAPFWSGWHQFDPTSAAIWAVMFVLHVLTPLVCLAFGFYVAFVRIWDLRAWLLLAVLVSFSILVDGSNSPDEVMRWTTPLRHAVLVYRSAGLYTWPLWMLIFAIYFPERAEFDIRHPRLKWIVLVPALFAFLLTVSMRIAVNEGGSMHASLSPFATTSKILSPLFLWISVSLSLIVLLTKALTTRDRDSKRRLRVLLAGLSLSLIPAFTLQAIATELLHKPIDAIPLWILIPVLSLFTLFPVTLAYVTVVQRALDVGVILRQSVQYALARRGVIVLQAIVSLFVIVCIAVFSGAMSFYSRLWIAALGIEVTLFVGLGARQLAAWIDRRFFREAYNTELVLTRLAIASVPSSSSNPFSKPSPDASPTRFTFLRSPSSSAKRKTIDPPSPLATPSSLRAPSAITRSPRKSFAAASSRCPSISTTLVPGSQRQATMSPPP